MGQRGKQRLINRRLGRSARALAVGFLTGYAPLHLTLQGAPVSAYYAKPPGYSYVPSPPVTIPYKIDPCVTAAMGGVDIRFNPCVGGTNVGVENGGEAWHIDGGSGLLYFSHNDSAGQQAGNVIVMEDLAEAQYNVLAAASTGCDGDGCYMAFDSSDAWYGGTGSPPQGRYDGWSVAAHEFGHWVALGHAQPDADPSLPSTDLSRPTMHYLVAGDLSARSISQDDANGHHRVRSATNTLANYSYETSGSPAWGWKYNANGTSGGAARYCDGAAHGGSCFVQFNGNGQAGSSVFQDLVDYGFHGTTEWDVAVWAKTTAPDGAGSQPITLAVWDLDRSVQLGETNCQVPTGGEWYRCPSSGNLNVSRPGATRRLRFEVYNNGIYNIAVDTAKMH